MFPRQILLCTITNEKRLMLLVFTSINENFNFDKYIETEI